MPNRDTPPRLVEAWLTFHNERLCRNLDAVFAFDGQRMEIWCRSEDNRDFRKLQKIVEPLKNSHNVELYITRLPKNSGENNMVNWTDMPPSLAENRELLSYLRPPAGSPPRVITYEDSEGQIQTRVLIDNPGAMSANAANRNYILRSRLTVWANRVLGNNRIMQQYAEDIPELIGVAFEPAYNAALRGRAVNICKKHAKDLAKSTRDLKKDLARAFPRAGTSAKTAENKSAAKKEPPATLSAVIEKADMIATETRALSRRIYRFIYPDQHTVDLSELKRPGLIVSLDALEVETRDFERALGRRLTASG